MSRPSSAANVPGRPNTRAATRSGSTPAAETTCIAGTTLIRPISVHSSAAGTPLTPVRLLVPGLVARPTPALDSPFLTANITSTAPIVATAAAAAIASAAAASTASLAGTAVDAPTTTPVGTEAVQGRAAAEASATTPNAPPMGAGEHRDVNSPTPIDDLLLPISQLVTATATALNSAPATAPRPDFPPLPSPGVEVMTMSAASRRRAAKRAAPPEDTPPLTPVGSDGSTVAVDVEPASETQSEVNLGSFFDAELATAVAASLGQDVVSAPQAASTSHRGPSPPKRPRIDTGSALFAPATQPQSAVSPMTREAVESTARLAVGTAQTAPLPHVPLPHVPLLPFPIPVHAPAPQYGPPPNAPNAAQQVVYDTRDGLPPNPGRHTTNPPPGGWQLRTSTEQPRVLRNLALRQEVLWRDSAALGPCILLQVHGGITNDVATARAITSFIVDRYNVLPNTFRVGIAGAEDPRARAPNAGIVAAETISTTAITFFTLPFTPSFTGYLGIIVGLGHDNTPAGAAAARMDIQASLTETHNPDFIRHILDNCDALPAHLTAAQVIAVFAASVHVVPIDLATSGGLQTEWRVFSVVTTNDINRYYATRAAFANIVFYTFSHGARIRADMNCDHCFSIDHPTGICPFPSTAGWMGNTHPTPTPMPPAITNIGANTNTNANANARGGSRGRGRARGCGSRGGRARGF
ncbi:hypothetical protein C8J57DRAFT_1235417 [Mycena rebaudengoi]|nr:hypothetical protein C8J57DRAFT_1235417 [Mycena rebaudengoi]